MHLSFLFAAFAVVWIGVLAYVISLARRNRELQHDLEDLRAVLDERGSGEGR
jgi:CcmD family protein